MTERRSLPVLPSVPLDPLGFGSLIRHLSGTLEDVVGIADAEGFTSVVGARMGSEIEALYRAQLGGRPLTREEVWAVLVDLKGRIGGHFEVVQETDDRVVLRGVRCPFGDKVHGRPSLCMMTSNVFGSIAASALGYARVDIRQSIAKGAPSCEVVVVFDPVVGRVSSGREYAAP
ncbi:MAG: methanogen output domain 1-containing protein [Polyangiales bacterium]